MLLYKSSIFKSYFLVIYGLYLEIQLIYIVLVLSKHVEVSLLLIVQYENSFVFPTYKTIS